MWDVNNSEMSSVLLLNENLVFSATKLYYITVECKQLLLLLFL